jgi:thymidylate synthase
MVVTMRSNDAYFGMPHDVFCFTMLQEIIARTLGREVGIYRHFASSLHLYKDHWTDAQHFVDEGYQQRITMPEMPLGDPWPAIATVLKAEQRVRAGEQFDANSLGLAEYWSDLIRIVQIYFARADKARVALLAKQLTFKRYRPYIIGRL